LCIFTTTCDTVQQAGMVDKTYCILRLDCEGSQVVLAPDLVITESETDLDSLRTRQQKWANVLCPGLSCQGLLPRHHHDAYLSLRTAVYRDKRPYPVHKCHQVRENHKAFSCKAATFVQWYKAASLSPPCSGTPLISSQ
ncbi:hypothetical protein KCU65_g31, partial [Aureobasidium melanogenum]